MDYIFQIRNLKVDFYKSDKLELFVPSLDIPRGKMIFVLGRSGCGKSTFMETLGLINNFFNIGEYEEDRNEEATILFYPEPRSKGINYGVEWKGNRELIATLRREYFNFVFQSENLLSQFNGIENIRLTSCIQSSDINENQLHLLSDDKHLKIKSCLDRDIKTLSGGEKQRIAFMRTVLRKGAVIFADEPTGNVGDDDAKIILSTMKDQVENNREKNNTAFVVTHNFDNALDYADQIYIIQKNDTLKSNIIIESNNILNKSNFCTEYPTREEQIDELRKRMLSHQASFPKIENITVQPIINSDSHINLSNYEDSKFRKNYWKQGTKDFSFRSARNLLVPLIILLAFLSIGIARGARDAITMKMSDPFLKWISLQVPFYSREIYDDLFNFFMDEDRKSTLSITDVSGYNRYPMNVFNDEGNVLPIFGRTIKVDDQIYNSLGKDNLVDGELFELDSDIGVIVTENFFKTYNYSRENAFFNYALRIDLNKHEYFPIPIRGIVKSLPDLCDFISTEYLYEKLMLDDDHPFNPTIESNLRQLKFFVKGDYDRAVNIESKLKELIKSSNLSPDHGNFVYNISALMPQYKTRIHGNVVTVYFEIAQDWNILKKLSDNLLKYGSNTDLTVSRIYPFPNTGYNDVEEFNRISLYVEESDKVSDINEYSQSQFDIEIDYAKIKSLESINSVKEMSITISRAIIIMCYMFICIFFYFVLYIHLYKNRKSLGVLKAFGVKHNTLKNIYIKRLLITLFISITISFIVSYSMGTMGFGRLFFTDTEDFLYFNIINMSPLYFLVALLLISLSTMHITASRILRKSPSDLIYDR